MTQAKEIMSELIRKAKEIVPEVIVEEHRLPEFDEVRKAKGGCRHISGRWLGVQIYYVDELQGIMATAHELGHLKTTNPVAYYNNPLYYEKEASSWGLNFLKDKLSKVELVECCKTANIWLKSYYEYYHASESNREYLNVPMNEEMLA